MRRRGARGNSSEINLDSLLDILSNVVGVMVLLAVMTVLSSQNIRLSLGTPLLRDPPTGARPLWFEARGNQLFEINEEVMKARRESAYAKYKQETGSEPAGRMRERVYEKYDIGDTNYRVQFQWAGGRNNYIYSPRQDVTGDTIPQLSGGTSNFEQLLRKEDPNRKFVSFIVRTDSFEAYNAARRIAEKHGFPTGWEPLAANDEKLIFKTDGTLGTQIQ